MRWTVIDLFLAALGVAVVFLSVFVMPGDWAFRAGFACVGAAMIILAAPRSKPPTPPSNQGDV